MHQSKVSECGEARTHNPPLLDLSKWCISRKASAPAAILRIAPLIHRVDFDLKLQENW